MNKKKLMALALAASIAIGGVATPFTSFAADENSGSSPVEGSTTESENETLKPEDPTTEVLAPEAVEDNKPELSSSEVEDRAILRQEINVLLNKVSALDLSKYTDKSVATLNSAVSSAKAAVADAGRTSAQLRGVKEALSYAYKTLVVKDEVDEDALNAQKQRINALNDRFNNLKPSDYTLKSYDTLKVARDAAIQGRDNPIATVSELKALADVFSAKFNELTEKENPVVAAEKKALEAYIKAVESLVKDKKYTKESREALANAIAKAKAVIADKNAILSDVNAAKGRIVLAKNELKEVKDLVTVKEAKRELLANLERGKKYLNDKKYTKASRYRLAKAIKAGYEVYNNTNTSLEEVLAAIKNVRGAIYNLELVNVKKPVKKVRKVLPQTGVESMSAMAMAAAALVGAGLVAARKRK